MIEPRTSLAMAVHSNPGVYAVLLGSGVSRAANIPTGWDVVKDLIHKVAVASGDDCEPDPEAWYTEKYGVEPTYTGLLEVVGKSQAERSRLLKSYFEPSEDELANGDKQPTKAHVALAQLVKRGSIRVILTTNFDRLMERALEAEGVPPVVISSSEAAEGATPLAHNDCTLVKLHGDYLDLETRNTSAELSSYDSRVDELLDRILDEYGLIVCGWSGEWDEALRKAILRRKARRFTTWWTSIAPPSEVAQSLISHCGAEKIGIQGADEVFDDLNQRLLALEQYGNAHPLSVQTAVALTKRYMSRPEYKIRLFDLLMSEVKGIISELFSSHFPLAGAFQNEDYAKRIRSFDELSLLAVHIVSTGCYWDREKNNMDIWRRAASILGSATGVRAGNQALVRLSMHPARLLLYAAGIAYSARKDFDGVHAVLREFTISQNGGESALAVALWDESVNLFQSVAPDSLAPVSCHVYDVLRPVFLPLLFSESEYRTSFDRFELLQSFFLASRVSCIPSAAYMARHEGIAALKEINRDVENGGSFLNAGFCGGDPVRFLCAKEKIEQKFAHRYS